MPLETLIAANMIRYGYRGNMNFVIIALRVGPSPYQIRSVRWRVFIHTRGIQDGLKCTTVYIVMVVCSHVVFVCLHGTMMYISAIRTTILCDQEEGCGKNAPTRHCYRDAIIVS